MAHARKIGGGGEECAIAILVIREVGTAGGPEAGGPVATFRFGAMPLPHVCRGPANVINCALKIRVLSDALHFIEDRLRRTADDPLALVSSEGAKGTSTRTATM